MISIPAVFKKLILILSILIFGVLFTGAISVFAMRSAEPQWPASVHDEVNGRSLSTNPFSTFKQPEPISEPQINSSMAGVGVIVDPTEVTVVEGGASAVYAMRLATYPVSTVTITVNTDGATSVSSSILVFDTTNWATPQAVVVTAVDDNFVELPHPVGLITHTLNSTSPVYGGLEVDDVTVQIVDDDSAGVQIAPTGLAVSEGGTAAAYTIALTSQPIDTVTVSLTASGGEVTIEPTSLTFEPALWDVAQAVVVTAVDDGDVEGHHHDQITHVATSNDPHYSGLSINALPVTITDNDAPGVLVSPTTVDLSEGGATNSYNIVLKSRPTNEVTIAISGGGEATFLPTSITFNPQNWNSPKPITVQAIDDNRIEGLHADTLTHNITTNDPLYGVVVVEDVSLSIADNDTAGVLVSPTFIQVSEGSPSAVYKVSLTSQPTNDVHIQINTDNQVAIVPEALIFTDQNWSVAQSVWVTAVDDAVVEAPLLSTITHIVSSDDNLYDQLAVNAVIAEVVDNDLVQVRISPQSVMLAEGGETGAYTVSLLSQPTATVTITQFTDGQTVVYPTELIFQPETWRDPQAVTVTAVDDNFYEGDHNAAVGHTAYSDDLRFHNLAINTLLIAVSDNDTAEVLVTPTNLSISEGGSGSSYAMRLISEPLFPVTVTITSTGQVSTSVTALRFDSLNWADSQAVGVTAVDDVEIEGTHSDTLTHTIVTADINFAGRAISNTHVTIIDDDTAGILIVPPELQINEGVSGTLYSVSLTGRPTQTVTITVNITDTALITISPTVLTYSLDNWQSAQAVTVTAVDNAYVNEAAQAIISHTVSSDDLAYNALVALDLPVTVHDDDMADVVVEPAVISLSEGSAPLTYSLRLTSQPQDPVSITITADAQTIVSPTMVTFTADNWTSAQILTVTAVDDLIGEGPHTGTISHTASSLDPNYDYIDISSVIVALTDNDVGGAVIAPQLLSLSEGGAALSYTVQLTSRPLANVEINMVVDGQTIVFPTTLTFTNDDWSTPQYVQVTAVDDELREQQLHHGLISHGVGSSDPMYDGIDIPAVTAEIVDNDFVGVEVIPQEISLIEGGSPNTYSVFLAGKPRATVTIHLLYDPQQVTVNVPDRLFFTSSNWQEPQTVTVTAVDNKNYDGQRNSFINHIVTSADADYDGYDVVAVTAVISDDEASNVLFLPIIMR